MGVTDTSGEDKLFVVCELKTGSPVFADVSYTGNLNGKLPQPTQDDPDIQISLTSYVSNQTTHFEFDPLEKKYVLDDRDQKPQSGAKYMLSVAKYSYGPDAKITVTMPNEVKSKNLEVLNYKSERLEDNTYKTSVECIISLIQPIAGNSYLILQAFTESGNSFTVNRVHENSNAFFILSHKPGFLIDYARLNSDQIHISYSVTENLPVDKLILETGNTTNQFYRYNIFASNVKTAGQSGTLNQSIAPFNLYSGDIWGSVSACNSHIGTYFLK
ncbi:MAG: hypothetical protein IPM42_18805 [Saprospiraceae bacterium]|nr:hypothetical protein [Saprospiraceae bacterium]